MAASGYGTALGRLLAHEGGYSNHPSDPGGPTNFGITLADYRRHVKANATAADVRAMQVEVASAIYRAQYWDALRCDELPAGVDYSVFDYGVNSGIGRSGKVLRRVLGLPDKDYRVTAEVLAALARRDPAAVIRAINDERLRFLQSLRTWPVFGAGWGRRVKEVRASSLAMAIAAARPAQPLEPAQPQGKGKAATSPAARAGAAAGVVVASGATAAAAGQGAGGLTAVLVLGAIGAAIAAWFGLRWWRARRQQRQLPGGPVSKTITH
jgi:lysozyme family protein